LISPVITTLFRLGFLRPTLTESTTRMFTHARSPILSLFSSSGSHPLQLFSTHTDSSLAADSFVHLLNDLTALPAPIAPGQLLDLPLIGPQMRERGQNTNSDNRQNIAPSGGGAVNFSNDSATATTTFTTTPDSVGDDVHRQTWQQIGRPLSQTVAHIQSPSPRTAFIRCPPGASPVRSLPRSYPAQSTSDPEDGDLGIKHHWMHVQVRNMAKPWSFEFGLKDIAGREGVVRCSTFQRKPTLKIRGRQLPLLHLPFAFPDLSSHLLTAWCTFAIHLPPLLARFSSDDLLDDHSETPYDSGEMDGQGKRQVDAQVPGNRYSHVTYVKVYATCRLKRIWFTEGGPTQKVPWEFALYGPTSVLT
jgi:hypothetical protein